jgi:hypothetical protein
MNYSESRGSKRKINSTMDQQCRIAQQILLYKYQYVLCRKIRRGLNVDFHSKSNLGNNSAKTSVLLESHSTPKGPTGLAVLPYVHARSCSSRSLVVREVSWLAISEDCNALATIRRTPSAYHCLKPVQSDYSPDLVAQLPEATSEERHALAFICWTRCPHSLKPV